VWAKPTVEWRVGSMDKQLRICLKDRIDEIQEDIFTQLSHLTQLMVF